MNTIQQRQNHGLYSRCIKKPCTRLGPSNRLKIQREIWSKSLPLRIERFFRREVKPRGRRQGLRWRKFLVQRGCWQCTLESCWASSCSEGMKLSPLSFSPLDCRSRRLFLLMTDVLRGRLVFRFIRRELCLAGAWLCCCSQGKLGCLTFLQSAIFFACVDPAFSDRSSRHCENGDPFRFLPIDLHDQTRIVYSLFLPPWLAPGL